mmetsp:Transcript_16193/g.29520  ORF Transcript_16193/g.29520 Transcript_16193/m.29520 type:complete len:312 (+) Transcript_16193:39-974(+)
MVMLSRAVRAFSTKTVALNSAIPPKLRLNVSHTNLEFVLDPEKRVKDFIAEIIAEVPQVGKVEVKTADNTAVDGERPLEELVKQCFWLHMDDKTWRIYPNVRHIMGGNLSLLRTCEELGIPMKDAQKVSQFYEDLTSRLPENFTKHELQQATKEAYASSNSIKNEDMNLMRHMISEFKLELEPLESQVAQCRQLSQQYAQRVLRLGQLALITQFGVLGYGTFVTYGWDVMEPVSYMVGITWATLGYCFFAINKNDFEITSYRELLEASRYQKLLKKQEVDLDRISVLKKNIQALEHQLEEMESLMPFKTFA